MGIKSIKWVDVLPPRIGGKPSKLTNIVRTLKGNPGRWAEVAAFNNIRQVRTLSGSLRSKGLQVSVRKAGGGWTRVYARYNSPVSAIRAASK